MSVLLGTILQVPRDYATTHFFSYLHLPHQVMFRKTPMATYGSKVSLQMDYFPSLLLVQGRYIALPLFHQDPLLPSYLVHLILFAFYTPEFFLWLGFGGWGGIVTVSFIKGAEFRVSTKYIYIFEGIYKFNVIVIHYISGQQRQQGIVCQIVQVYARGERGFVGWNWLTMHFIRSALLCSSVRSTTEPRK